MAPSLSLILRQTVQAVLLSGIANTLAQLIQITRSPIHQSFNFQRLLQYLIFVVLNTPPNILWQAFLEDCFPGTTMQPHVRHYQRSTRAEDFSDLKEPSPLEDEKGEYERKAAKQDLAKWEDDKKQWTEEVKLEPRFDVKNTAWKFALDQTIGALVNTVIFVAGMAGLRGEGWKSAIDHIRLVRSYPGAQEA